MPQVQWHSQPPQSQLMQEQRSVHTLPAQQPPTEAHYSYGSPWPEEPRVVPIAHYQHSAPQWSQPIQETIQEPPRIDPRAQGPQQSRPLMTWNDLVVKEKPTIPEPINSVAQYDPINFTAQVQTKQTPIAVAQPINASTSRPATGFSNAPIAQPTQYEVASSAAPPSTLASQTVFEQARYLVNANSTPLPSGASTLQGNSVTASNTLLANPTSSNSSITAVAEHASTAVAYSAGNSTALIEEPEANAGEPEDGDTINDIGKSHGAADASASDDVKSWLLQRGPDYVEYYSKFASEGFSDFASVALMTDEHLKELGVKMGHRLVILKVGRLRVVLTMNRPLNS